MSWTLNNIETTAEYPQVSQSGSVRTAILLNGPAAIAELDVYNAAIFLQLLVSDTGEEGQGIWMPELFVAPSHRALVRRTMYGIRFRSALPAAPAQVTVELIPEDETWLSVLVAAPGTL